MVVEEELLVKEDEDVEVVELWLELLEVLDDVEVEPIEVVELEVEIVEDVEVVVVVLLLFPRERAA